MDVTRENILVNNLTSSHVKTASMVVVITALYAGALVIIAQTYVDILQLKYRAMHQSLALKE